MLNIVCIYTLNKAHTNITIIKTPEQIKITKLGSYEEVIRGERIWDTMGYIFFFFLRRCYK